MEPDLGGSAPLPKHVAIIMDGNGRWAKARGLPRFAGHKAGVDSVREVVRASAELGISVLTLYAFSTENWLRPKSEVTQLMRLLCHALRRETVQLGKNNIRLRAIGRLEALPKAVQEEFAQSMRQLADNDGLLLNIALNYGSRQEIADAVARLVASGKKNISEIDVSSALYTAGLPDPDLVIRTSGEMRLSNFLLWQSAYAEFYVTPVYWPDFRRRDFLQAVAEYQKRGRRFGGL